jgi:hypothetical protein
VEIRYLGFDQLQNSRVFRFEVREKGLPNKHVAVTANMDIFRIHRVGIQEGPSLSGIKLTADLESGGTALEHELTAADVRAYADSKTLAEAQRAALRKNPRRQPTAPAVVQPAVPWRNFGI